MKKITFCLLGCVLAFTTQAQDPSIIWQKTIGGSGVDVMTSAELTSDGGYVLGGYSPSNISGEKSENSNGLLDIWIVKTDANGNIQWQNTIGGSGDDYCNVVKQTADGGYIVLGGSNSNISGDKTENSRGGLDYWIIKLNPNGVIEWQKTYGGANPDFDTYGEQTADGGYIVAGYSDSDVTGDKTVPTRGQRDYWVLKLNSTGGIVWQKAIGGSLVDRVQAASQTADGGYVIGGFSTSGITGDKTEANYGGTDYWIVKLDSAGTIQWQNTIGGSASDAFRDLIKTADGGYLVGGYSQSNISGEKTENSNGDYDYWVIKLQSNGSIEWQNTIGGAGVDYLRDLKQLADGSYLVSGYSNSAISGDKTENSAGYDYWLVKLNASGTIVSQNTLGGSADESGPYTLPLADGGFLLACSSASSISGDKTEDSRGLEDYWIFKVDNTVLGTKNHNWSAFTAFPNPGNGNLTLDLGRNFSQVEVSATDVSGKRVLMKRWHNADSVSFAIDSQPGLYIVQVLADGLHQTFKIVKN